MKRLIGISMLLGSLLLGSLVLSGCGARAAQPLQGTPAGTLQSAPGQAASAAAAACSANRVQLATQYSVAQSGAAADGSVSFESVVQSTGTKCPTGGTYSWDAGTNKVKCSIHGE